MPPLFIDLLVFYDFYQSGNGGNECGKGGQDLREIVKDVSGGHRAPVSEGVTVGVAVSVGLLYDITHTFTMTVRRLEPTLMPDAMRTLDGDIAT